MSRTVTENHTFTGHPVSYDDTDHSWYTISNMSSGYADSSNTSYATINDTRGSRASTWVYFEFDTSSIPDGADITSVACTAKCVMNGNSSATPTKQMRMYSGTTAKGSAFTGLGTSTAVRTLSVGTWTLQELRDARIWLNAVRGTSNTTTNYYIRFYGATLTVNYSTSVTYYTVSASASGISGVTVSPTSDEYAEGNNATVTISGVNGREITVLDNGNDVTDQLVTSGSDLVYTLSSIAADHVIVVTSSGPSQSIFYKQNGSWVPVSAVYLKQNGAWQQASTMHVKVDGSWES